MVHKITSCQECISLEGRPGRLRMMNTGNSAKKIIFLHIPKAGGTTLYSVIQRNYDANRIYTLAGTRHAMQEFMNLPSEEINRYDCVQGHMGFGFHKYFAEDLKYITLMRDPLKRVVSLYFYILRTPQHYLYNLLTSARMGLNEFVESGATPELYDGQTRLLASESGLGITFDDKRRLDRSDLARAKQHLRDFFILVGTLDQFDEFLLAAQRILGWEDVSYEKKNVRHGQTAISDIDDRTLKAISANNEIDFELYNYAQELFQKKLSECTQ